MAFRMSRGDHGCAAPRGRAQRDLAGHSAANAREAGTRRPLESPDPGVAGGAAREPRRRWEPGGSGGQKPRSEATISRVSGGGGPVRRLTTQVTAKFRSIPRVPMPSGLIPNHQASGPLHSKTLNQPI